MSAPEGLERVRSRGRSAQRFPAGRGSHGRVLSFLLDTNVVSEPRKGRRADTNVMRWFSSVAPDGVACKRVGDR